MPFTSKIVNAIENSKFDVVTKLIEEEKAWNDPNEQGLKPIHVAIDNGRLALVEWLLEKGVSLDCATSGDGATPLHRAVSKGQTKIVEHLLKVHRDDPNKKLADGTTPLHLAAIHGYNEIVNLLLNNNANCCKVTRYGASPLYLAVRYGHHDTVKLLLDRGANISQSTTNGESPLYVAVREGHKETVALLLERRANINQTNINGLCPLYVAAREGHREIVALLLRYPVNISILNRNGESSLFIAAKKGHTEIVAKLLECNANINETNMNGESPLYIAAREGYADIVTLLLMHGANVKQNDNNRVSPLRIATQRGYKDIVSMLLTRGADISQVDEDGSTLLFFASINGDIDIMNLLLDRGIGINQTNYSRTSPLFVAARSGSIEAVNLLLIRGANVNQVNKDGASPLWIAAQSGRIDVVMLLLKCGANIHQADSNGVTPLHIAAQQGHKDMVAFLLENNANIDQADSKRRSSLYIAASENHKDIVTLLLESRANIDQADINGVTPLYVAAKQGHRDIVALLLERGANINQVNKDGETPLYAAAREGRVETVNLLIRRGADNKKANNNKITPLWVAAYHGHHQVVNILSKSDRSMTPNSQGDTPLHIAVKQGHISVVKVLLENNLYVNKINASEETPLMLAAAAKNDVIFGLFLAYEKQIALLSSKQESKKNKEEQKSRNFQNLTQDYAGSVIVNSTLSASRQNFSEWPAVSPAALTLAKKNCQALSLEIKNQGEVIGKGAFGKVLCAEHPRLGKVAIKETDYESLARWLKVTNEEAKDISQWEISQLEKVHHPHVVELLGTVNSDTPLLIMELCDKSLDKHCPKTPYEMWQVAWEVACGLAYLHSLGLVHRDIKLENILLKDGIAKIADMGLARSDPIVSVIDEPKELQKIDGDPKYFPPEVDSAKEKYREGKCSIEEVKAVNTPAADIYRYGLAISSFGQKFLSTIIHGCLQPNPQDRLSALQVLSVLEEKIPHEHPVLAKLCQRLGIFAHYHQHELANFLIPWVSRYPDVDWLKYHEGIEIYVKVRKDPEPFTSLWKTFLSNRSERCLDLRGAGGLGKTLLGYYQLKEQWLALRQWLKNPQGNPPTLLLLLTPDYLYTTVLTIEERLAKIYQLTPDECETLREYPVVFLLDGEDEWQAQAQPQLDLARWPNAKIWIVGRPSDTAKNSFYLLPFNQVQIIDYLRQTLNWDEATIKDFITKLPLSQIKEVLRNPFVLSMFRSLWPIPNWQELTTEDIYHRYFTQFIERQQEHWLKGPYRNIYEKLIKELQQEHETLAESYLSYAGEVSLQLFEERRLEGKVEVRSPWGTINKQVAVLAEKEYQEKQHSLAESKEKTHLTLQEYQTFALAHGQRITLQPPFYGDHYRFMHKSLLEYAWAYTGRLPNRPLEEDESLLIAYIRLHHGEKPDFSLIDATKQDPTLAAKAGNLLTLYNWARLPLTHDYRGAHIENANLAYADLTRADLRGVTWTNCYFENTCFLGAKVDYFPVLNIARRPHPPLLGHSNTILLSAISSNGQYLATLDQDKVFIWDNQQRVGTLSIKIESPTALAIDNNGALLIGDKNGVVYFYSIKTGLVKHINTFHDQPVLNVAFISHQQCWAGGNFSNVIYDSESYVPIKQWQNNLECTCVAVESQSLQQAVASTERLATVDISNIQVNNIPSYTLYQGGVTALSFSPDGKLAAAFENGLVTIINKNIDSKKLLAFFLNQPFLRLQWSQDGELLVAISLQGFKIWNKDGKELGSFHATNIQAVYMKNSHEGILVEKSGNLYGIRLDNRQLEIIWAVAGESFQGGITIMPIDDVLFKMRPTKKQNIEEKIEPRESGSSNQISVSAAFRRNIIVAPSDNNDQQGRAINNGDENSSDQPNESKKNSK